MVVLVVAALANVVVAWGAALFAPAPGFDPQATAALRRAQEPDEEDGPSNGPDVWIDGVWRTWLVTTTISTASVNGEKRTTFDHGFGWPRRCMFAQQHSGGGFPPRQTYAHGYPLDQPFDLLHPYAAPPRPMYKLARIVPMQPGASGLATNTAAYGIGGIVALIVWRSGRFLGRRLRQRCPACGYRLVSLDGGCPECGRNHIQA